MNKLDKIIKESITKILKENRAYTLEESIRKFIRESLEEIGGINDNIPYGNWMLDYDERDYPNIFGEADDDGFDNMEADDVKRLKGNYYEVAVPEYCLPYLVNGDTDNYTDEEIEAMKAFENEFNGKLANGLTVGDCCIPLDGASPSFCYRNDVTKSDCNCYIFCLPMKKENVHEAKSNKKEEYLDYTHYAVNKQTGKIVNGWDYNGYDSEDLKTFKRDYFFDDLASYDLNPKDYKIVTKKFLIRQGINPDDYANWSNN